MGVSEKRGRQHYDYEVGLLEKAKDIDSLNYAWTETLKGLGLDLDSSRAGDKSYDLYSYRDYYNWGRGYLTSLYERRMEELGGTAYPEDWQKLDLNGKDKHQPGYQDYINMEKSAEEARKARNEVTSLNEQAHQIANRKKLQEDKDAGRNPRIPGSDSSQTMLTGRDRGKATMLTRGYQPRTLMGG